MISNESLSQVHTIINVAASIFIFIAGMVVLVIFVTFLFDITQTKQALRRNYPVVSHFRYFFEGLGSFFRQLFLCYGSRRNAV